MEARQLAVDESAPPPAPPRPKERLSWTSKIGFAVLVVLGIGLIWLTRQKGVLALWAQLAVTIPWVVGTVIMGLNDIVYDNEKPGVNDRTPFDRWTMSHIFVGAVFAVWYIPFWAVIAMTLVWEAFEYYIPGFGDKETMVNRAVDVVGAWVMYAICVIVIMGTRQPGIEFPLLWPNS